MAVEFEMVDVWVGRFRSPQAFEAYLAESYGDEDSASTSAFAADQGVVFYDHDLMESSFLNEGTDLASGLRLHSFAASYADAVVDALDSSAHVVDGNAILLVWGREIPVPTSVAGIDFTLRYVGRFACRPDE